MARHARPIDASAPFRMAHGYQAQTAAQNVRVWLSEPSETTLPHYHTVVTQDSSSRTETIPRALASGTVVVGPKANAGSLNQLLRSVGEMEAMSDGWDGYHAVVPNSWSVAKARDALVEIFEKSSIVVDGAKVAALASAEGGVVISVYSGTKVAHLEISNDCDAILALDDNARSDDPPRVFLVDADRFVGLAVHVDTYLETSHP